MVLECLWLVRKTPKGQVFTEIALENFSLSGLLVTTGDKMTKPSGLNSACWKILGALTQAQSQPDVIVNCFAGCTSYGAVPSIRTTFS